MTAISSPSALPLLRLATDKIDVDVEAEADGIMARAVPNGTTLPPGAVLGWLLAPGEAAPAGAAPVAAAAVVVDEASPVAADCFRGRCRA
jgi:pyruvate dehydrogenase E2 component (dihydrolipoamide acetyltransferase)